MTDKPSYAELENKILYLEKAVEDRDKIEKAHMAEKEFTKAALNSLQDIAVLFDPESGRVVRWNEAFVRVTGYSHGQIPEILVLKTCFSTRDQERIAESLVKVIETGTDTIELDLVCSDGHKVPMEFNISVLRDQGGQADYLISIGRDITERKQADAALQISQKRFLTVLDSIDATVYVVEMDTHRILFMNQNMKKAFGRDMTGEICWEAFRGESGPCDHCPNQELLDENDSPTGVFVWQTKNPVTGKWYMNYDRAIEWTDGRLVKLQIATDITDLKKMEEELRQAHKMESIGTLAGGVAHDFNNILGIIMGNAELALDDTPSWSPVSDHIREIKTASLRAKDVVRQLLSFSRKTQLEQKPLDMAAVIKESLGLIRSSIPTSIEIRPSIPERCPAVLADATQIHQVVINLCTNAVHAMSEAGGIIHVQVAVHTLGGKSEGKFDGLKAGDYLELSVKDSGQGIEPGVREKMFDPYFTTKEVGKGTGMGLAVVHGIVQNHGGHIHVDSEPGTGTCFNLFFPVVDAMPQSEKSETLPDNAVGKENILFVDDEPPITKMSTRILEKLGYWVEAVLSPEKALDIFQENPNRFDLVISDMTMPGMSGTVLCEKIKALRPDIPVIICTGHSAYVDEEKAMEMGIAAYVMKPVSRARLSKVIRRVLDNSPLG